MKSNPVYPSATIIFWSVDVRFPANHGYCGTRYIKRKLTNVMSIQFQKLSTQNHIYVLDPTQQTFLSLGTHRMK